MNSLSRRTIVAGIAAAVPAAAMGAVPALASPDAELLDLGRQLEQLWGTARATYARLHDVHTPEAYGEIEDTWVANGPIVEQIEVTPATTLAGLKVKARAIAWCSAGEPFADDSSATDQRIVASLLADLEAMGDAS